MLAFHRPNSKLCATCLPGDRSVKPTSNTEDIAALRLKRGEERRLRAGHCWVFSNEIDTVTTPLKNFDPGQPVLIESASGKPVGRGYVNPHSLIAARLISRDHHLPLAQRLIEERVRTALALRARYYQEPFYRCVFGESDGLPGLVVDRFGDYLVAQVTTAGMERVLDSVIGALQSVLQPQGILLRNDGAIRELEGLERYVELVSGAVPEQLEVRENGCRFMIDPRGGQKTGWFYDHRENRVCVARHAQGQRVLDLFSYTGAWGVQAAVAGAAEVTCVDSSQAALELAGENAELNGVDAGFELTKGDAFDVLSHLRHAQRRFDIVVVNPPAFIKRRKDHKRGVEAYRRLNQAAMQLLEPGGLLLSASCSHHLERSTLVEVIMRGARHIDRTAQLLEFGYQAPDHPMHPAIPETAYLKAVLARVLPGAW